MTTIIPKLVELEGICNYFNIMLGIELEINVKEVERKEGMFYGKSLIKELSK